ncbi:cytochrome ubiquinol oxidase subunit I [Brevibacterium jeotgali]|uniref:Cytochrome bd-I ubiquinol oxidase subunit 1 apoprotein n=1 Tax=Brevibacterium jeotgali TaxID=1262550 RepID=A0A2H1L748_9MICO|nr:cytochrome ubiquinol oxidase subunit I [Brevibacterium jeotgali]TWC02675.1 cytochrome bd-I ubiquinol oxidase subunit 1 apoprotein [Brevibacterium jeotgali]SMY12585.1 cytochrome bd-I ubiquinol oxidase subunit 1 apoprotein [Brevibacterium jeotgali]
MELDPVLIARWQFGITTVYHFWMVPLTLGLGVLVAVLQTRWHRTGSDVWLRATKFWGKLYLINFIMGVATGLVQEFQFGMAWSEYSRFVGDVFGAPLAMEALLAFFLESIFIGVWIFGWGRISRRAHLTVLWCAVIGSWISAYFIIVANSWMQHPVGVELIDGRPVMTDVVAVLTNSTALAATSHTLAGALSVGAALLLGISWHHLWRRRVDGIDTVDEHGRVIVGSAPDIPGRDAADYTVWWRSLRIGAWVAVFSFAAVALTGDIQAKLMYEQQPMKMASAEAACHDGTAFSVLTIGDLESNSCEDVTPIIEIPGVLSFLAKGDVETDVPGVTSLIPEYQDAYGTHLPEDEMYGERSGTMIDYQPSMFITYWGFRLMIGFGALAAAAAVFALFITRRGTVPRSRFLSRLALWGIAAPFIANSAGWIFTEMGRQPFVVAPNPDPSGIDGVFLYTAAAVSPSVSAAELLTSVILLTLVYGVLMVFELKLIVQYTRGGVVSAMPELGEDPAKPTRARVDGDEDDVLSFAY